MLLLIVRIIFALVSIGTILAYVTAGLDDEGPSMLPAFVERHRFVAFVVLLFVTQAAVVIDLLIRRKRIDVISAVYIGLLMGVLLAYLLTLALTPALARLQQGYQDMIVMLITLIVPYWSISLILQTKDDFRFIIPYVEFSREVKGGRPLIVDSSALIDGRIADVVETRILDAELIVPEFILHEVQEIADSNDKMRRTRGRRGLDVLTKLQNSPHCEVQMYESNDAAELTVDQRLVALAKKLRGRVITNDFNLNKVASVQGVDVINLNDVANSLKPRYIPGERLTIKLIKEGEAAGQGVGYLDDGTMVICEQTAHLIGREIDCIVTSVLQSSAGRMIFSRQVHPTGASAERS
ncbi:MAG: PIN/TRAM domain-containing protein [Planctomycetes bacterium]|nr:PIN/TRAM domain-containing protein [Planctomycetota bacterium]